MNKSYRILCVIPAYNEEGKIGRVVSKVVAAEEVDQIVVVDDCSSDNTSREAEKAGALVIRHERNRGVGAGIRSGLSYGCDYDFDIAVILSGDDQHEPKELPLILDPLRKNEAQFVQGSRRLPGGKTVNGPFFREIMTRIYSLAFTFVTAQRITDGTNGFRAFFLSILDHEDIDIDQKWLGTYELEPYLLYKAVRSPGIKVVERPITIYYKYEGDRQQYSKMKPFRDWWRLARPLIYLKLGIRR